MGDSYHRQPYLDQGDDAIYDLGTTEGGQQQCPEAPGSRHDCQQWIFRHLLHMRRDLVIAAQTTLILHVTKSVIPCAFIELAVKDITLIVAKEIVAVTIVKATEVRAKEKRAMEKRTTKNPSTDLTVKEVIIVVSASQIATSTIRVMPEQHLPSDVIAAIISAMQTLIGRWPVRPRRFSHCYRAPCWWQTPIADNYGRFWCHAPHV
jgi:phosphatidylglycerophosphatase A